MTRLECKLQGSIEILRRVIVFNIRDKINTLTIWFCFGYENRRFVIFNPF